MPSCIYIYIYLLLMTLVSSCYKSHFGKLDFNVSVLILPEKWEKLRIKYYSLLTTEHYGIQQLMMN